jgi:hydrogenase expression/formation protein HypE
MAEPVVTLAHGGGGAGSQQLLRELLLPLLAPEHAACLEDAALVARAAGDGDWAYTTDGFIVKPLIFPGGDIGKLAVCGTVNDLAMRGARPEVLTVSMILEEGLPLRTLATVVRSMRAALDEVGARIVAGDTKVVERGRGDGIFLSMSGLGPVTVSPAPSAGRARPGDRVVISGAIGDHGIAVLAAREDLGFSVKVESDCAPLWSLVETMLQAGDAGVHVLRDPTRGGVAAVLNEIAMQSRVGTVIMEDSLVVDEGVRGACDLLGFDPLTIANEGKVLAFVAPERVEAVLAAMRAHPLGRKSAVIGEVIEGSPGRVLMETAIGTRRLVDMPSGELLPRIC